MVHLSFNKAGDPAMEYIIQTLESKVPAHDPEYVKTPQGIYSNYPFSGQDCTVPHLENTRISRMFFNAGMQVLGFQGRLTSQ